MRLTVGPQPAAVYWRRRAVVLVGLAIIVLIVSYACGATTSSNAGSQPSGSPTGSTPAATATLLHPTSASPKPTTKPTTTPSPTPTAYSLVTATAASGPCSDTEMSVAVKAASAQVQRGQTVSFTITIKNASSRTCSRDVGADMQELRLLDGTSIIWSSDDCSPNKGHDVRSFAAGKEVSFTLTWQGRRSRSGTGNPLCTNAPYPDAQAYQLIGRLDQKLSQPFALTVRA